MKKIDKIIKESINKVICEAYSDMNFDDGYIEKHTNPKRRETADDYLNDNLQFIGAGRPMSQGGDDEDIAIAQRDLWVNFNRLINNITFLYNKTRDDNYAKLGGAVSDALELIPFDTSDLERQVQDPKNYEHVNYEFGEGERTNVKYKGQDEFKRQREEEYKRKLKDYCEKNGCDYEKALSQLKLK
jgi:hypothetical protein